MRTPWLVALTLAATAGLAAAQQPTPEAETPDQLYERCFSEGLQAITARELKRAEALFRVCVRTFPDRPVAYYNLACTYALGKDAKRAMEQVRLSFERGYQDLSHMGRDMDFDQVRTTPEYRQCVKELGERILAEAPAPLAHVPAEGNGLPVLVYLPDQEDVAKNLLDELRQTLPGWVIVVPQGVRDPREQQLDPYQKAEFITVRRVRDFLGERAARVAQRQVFIAGEGIVGRIAVKIAAHQPDLFAGVLGADFMLGGHLDGVDVSGLRAYLIVKDKHPAQVPSAMRARDTFAKAGCPVVLERYARIKPLLQDRALLLRALNWLRGELKSLPGAGREEMF